MESELVAKTANVKTKDEMIEKRLKYGFLVVAKGWTKYGTVIRNLMVQWTSPEDPRGYDETIQQEDSSFDCNKGKKKHIKKVIEYEKFSGVEEHI